MLLSFASQHLSPPTSAHVASGGYHLFQSLRDTLPCGAFHVDLDVSSAVSYRRQAEAQNFVGSRHPVKRTLPHVPFILYTPCSCLCIYRARHVYRWTPVARSAPAHRLLHYPRRRRRNITDPPCAGARIQSRAAYTRFLLEPDNVRIRHWYCQAGR